MTIAEADKTAGGDEHKNHDTYSVPGLRRGLLLLETLADAQRPLSLSEIAKRLKLTRSAVFRLTYTLRFMGFLDEVGDTKSFTLGPRVLNIGYAYLASKDILELSRADLESLRDRTNISVNLAIRDRKDVLYLACLQPASGFITSGTVGTRQPAHATPTGWLLLSDLSHRELSGLYGEGGLAPLTMRTPRNLADLTARVSEAVAHGHAIARGDVELGVSSIAAPVLDREGRVIAAIDISGPDTAFDFAQIETRYVREVVDAALRISARLGYVPSQEAPGWSVIGP